MSHSKPDRHSLKRYPPVVLATCPIPWTADFELDEPVFRETVAWLAQDLTPHLYLFGTAGEGYAVSDGQFLNIARVFREVMPAASHPMLGVISLSLRTIVDRIAAGREIGFRDFQLSLPSWGALTDAEVDVFFAETCGRFPDCRFLHYNLMRTKRLLTGDDYARLAARHSNLVAVKMGGENLAAFEDILMKAPAVQGFFTEFGYAGLRDRHECGLLAALSAAHHGKAHAFFAARGAELAFLAAEFRSVHQAIKAAIDPVTTHIDGAYDKVYLKRLRRDFPLLLLPPYAYSDDGAVERFEQRLPPTWKAKTP